jgi:hypothetical protein
LPEHKKPPGDNFRGTGLFIKNFIQTAEDAVTKIPQVIHLLAVLGADIIA